MIRVLTAALLTALAIAGAHADDYPSRPVKIIVPTPPGGPVDVIARITANYLQNALGKGFVVENRAGAGNTIGSKDAAEATPDGYTLLYSSASGLVIAPLLHPDAGYDPLASFDPVALVGESSNILVVNPSVPANTVQELVAYAKANPGKVNFSSGGIGVLPHLIGEMFKARAGLDIVHVPYKGAAPALEDLISGQDQMMFATAASVVGMIKNGQVRALAVTTLKRTAILPDVPTVDELGIKGFEATTWHGLVAPAGTPKDIIATLYRATIAALDDPEVRQSLGALGVDIVGDTPDEFSAYIQAEIPKWAEVIKASGAKAQ